MHSCSDTESKNNVQQSPVVIMLGRSTRGIMVANFHLKFCFIIIDTLSQEDPLNSSHASFTTKCSVRKVTRFITNHVRTAYTVWETAQELHYILPFKEAKKGNFEKLFQVKNYTLMCLCVYSDVPSNFRKKV